MEKVQENIAVFKFARFKFSRLLHVENISLLEEMY